MARQILLIEDELKIARFLQLELESEGYDMMISHDGQAGLMLARDHLPDLIIVDWMLPGLTGVEICRRLRATGNQTPVIMLTGRDDIHDRITGLDAGADDYLIKPFSVEELLARIRARFRQQAPETAEWLEFDNLRVNQRTREVYRDNRLVELTVKEFDLLTYLLSRPRQVFTREQILNHVWGYDFLGDSNIIEVYIRYLRLKLESPEQPRLIHTVRGVGYSLRRSTPVS